MKHLTKAKQLQRSIHEALIREWDPIGVGNIPEAQDEYDLYVIDIYNLLVSQAPKDRLFQYLWWLETEHMGLMGDYSKTEKFTERLINLFKNLERQCRKNENKNR